jgi:hypothetical protein
MRPNFEGQVMERFLICKNPLCRFVIDLRTKKNQVVQLSDLIISRSAVNVQKRLGENTGSGQQDSRPAHLRITLDSENTRAHKECSGRRRISPHCSVLVRRAPVIQLRSPKWQI